MSDNNLRLQVILNAVDKLTRPFRAAQASSKELAGAIRNSRDALKQLNQAGNSLEKFRKLQADNKKLGDRLNYARQKANLLSSELEAMEQPSQRHLVALGRQTLAVQRLEEQQKYLQKQTALVRAELYRAGISAKDDAGATARLARETSRYNQELAKQEARLKRLGEAQRRMNAARASYARSLEVRDRIAGAGATTTAAGLAMGAPVMAAVKSYTSMEDAMKGVAKQVNGLRDDNGNRTARFYEMQDAIKAASEQLPMEKGAVDFAALVEGGARMNVANPDDSWEDQKRDLLAFASTAAKAATAFELPADELSESLGKIAQLYKIPTRNIEQLGDALNYLDDNAMSKGADIIDVMQRLGGVADRLDYRRPRHLGCGAGCSAGAAGSHPSGILCAGHQNVTFRYGSSNTNQQRVVLVSWRSTGTAATRACFIGQRSGFTYCAVVVFAPHGITDGECPENCSRCAGCTVAVWIIRFTCCCCDVYESTGSTTRWTGCRRRGAASTGIRSAGDAARCSVCRIWPVRCSAQSDRSCGYCTGGRGTGCLEILATHHCISRWRGGRIQSGGRSHQ